MTGDRMSTRRDAQRRPRWAGPALNYCCSTPAFLNLSLIHILAITVPLANSKPMLVSMLAAGVVAWTGQVLPLRLGLAAAVIAGVVAGMWAERFFKARA